MRGGAMAASRRCLISAVHLLRYAATTSTPCGTTARRAASKTTTSTPSSEQCACIRAELAGRSGCGPTVTHRKIYGWERYSGSSFHLSQVCSRAFGKIAALERCTNQVELASS